MNTSRLKNSTFLLLAIIILALSLRLYHLNFQSLWIDEIVSMIEADPEITLQTVIDKTVVDQPPAYFILLHGWFKLVSYTDLNGRLLSVLIGITSVIAMFFLGKEVKDEKVGLIAALFTAINYLNIIFSQEVRFYSFLFLFTSLSYLFLIRCVKFIRISDFILYIISTTIVVYSHYYGLVVIASQGIIFVGLLILFPVNKKFVGLSIASGLMILAAFSPWLPIIFSDIGTSNFWIQQVTFFFPFEYFYVYFKDVVACCVFAILILLYFFKLFKSLRAKEGIDPTNFVLVGWGILSFLIPLTYSIVRIPMLHVRYTIIALPCLIIMISLGFYLIKDRIRTILLITTTSTILLSLFFIEKHYTKIQKEDWRGMIAGVLKEASENDVFVSEYSYYCNYYFRAYNSNFRAVQAENFNPDSKPQRIWWLEAFDVRRSPTAAEQLLLNNGYTLEKKNELFNARSVLYSLPAKGNQ